MINAKAMDFSVGYEKFDALSKNLEGIFEKVYAMQQYKIDITYYEKKFQEFKEEFKLKDNFLQSTKMPFKHMQNDYEAFQLAECNKKLELLTNDFEENITPIYNIYLLFNNIDKLINTNNINEVIKNTKTLINSINSINTHNKIDITNLISRAYQTIYKALLFEKMYHRNEILKYIELKNNSSNKENLGKIIREELKDLLNRGVISTLEIDKESITHIEDGLSYDYLSPEFLELLSIRKEEYRYNSIRRKAEEEYQEIKKTILTNEESQKKQTSIIQNNKSIIKNLTINSRKLKAKKLSLVAVPTIAIITGSLTGTIISRNINEYLTTTRTINLETGDLVGEVSSIYDDNLTTYVATITVFEPWKNNPSGKGFIRNAISYEYIPPEVTEEDYHISINDINDNVREKYRFSEAKDILDENDSTTKRVIEVTETYQDKNNSRKSTKYIIPGTLIGIGLGAILDVILILLGFIDLHSIAYELERIDNKIKRYKLDNDMIEKELKKLIYEQANNNNRLIAVQNKYGITRK